MATYSVQLDEWVWAWRRIRERSGLGAGRQLPVLALVVLAIGVFGVVRDGWTWFSILFVAIGALSHGLMLIEWRLPYWVYRRIPEDRATQRLVVTAAEIESGTEDYRIRVPWSSVRGVERGATDASEIIVLLVLDQKDAFIIPRRVLDDAQWRRVEHLVEHRSHEITADQR